MHKVKRFSNLNGMYNLMSTNRNSITDDLETLRPQSEPGLTPTHSNEDLLRARSKQESLSDEKVEGGSLSDEKYASPLIQSRSAWRPSLLRLGPLSGLFALAFAFLQIFASYGILKASAGKQVTQWTYQPNVYLAVLTALSNKALSYAVVQGAVITWWLRAVKGTSLAQLHRDWSYGQFASNALVAGRHFNMLALACLCATLVAIDGPLLQRASSVKSSIPQHVEDLEVSITPEIPSYFTGWAIFNTSQVDLDWSIDFLPVQMAYAQGAPISSGIDGCVGTCRAKVLAPALVVDSCESTLVYTNFSEPLSGKDQEIVVDAHATPKDRVVFSVSLSTTNGTTEHILFQTKISDQAVANTCAGNVNTTQCSLASAIAEYEVLVQNNIITFVEPPSYPRILRRADNTAITDETVQKYGLVRDTGDGFIKSTLSGIALTAMSEFASSEGLAVAQGFGNTPTLLPGSSSWFGTQHISNLEAWENETQCAPAWKDPRDDIMAALNELMFRTGVYTAQHYNQTLLEALIDGDLNIHYNVTGTPQSPVSVFEFDRAYFVAAAAIQLATIVAILFTFYGWWRLGRSTSFSPLEIAKAFDAPLLDDLDSNQDGRHLAKIAGEHRIQYGVLNGENDVEKQGGLANSKLVFADRSMVRSPTGRMRTPKDYFDLVKASLGRLTRWSKYSKTASGLGD